MALLLWAVPAQARQLGALVAPGPLIKAHATVATACTQCHEAARKVPARKCLACHKPIADRIAKKSGVHRAVTDDCVSCHSEHVGADADIRRIDVKTFNHAAETGYALDGLHAPLERRCAVCHKSRSFLVARPACSTCHADPHKNTLGGDCASCHTTAVAFKQTRGRFDHSRARFALTGAHRTVTCEKCHANGQFRGVKFDTCASCHKEPHEGRLGPTCTTCHTTERWATRTVNHARTRYPLEGAHVQVACVKCHQASLTAPLKFDTCASCHTKVHRESVKDDCRACHTVASFTKGTFDHAARTSFPLAGKHAALVCGKCHTAIVAAAHLPLPQKVLDFGGVQPQCVSCHVDKHNGQYGRLCEACHRDTGFSVTGFSHPRAPEFYEGNHLGVACVRCHGAQTRLQPTHTPPRAAPEQNKTASMECASCHSDPHLGQLGLSCERCHAVTSKRFAAVRFSHDAVAFRLTGKHQSVDCVKCHPSAVRYKLPSTACATCHKDQHLGQLPGQCETCHSTATFAVPAYKHKGFEQFFAGSHGALACKACHKQETGVFPAGRGTAVRYKVGTTCTACHNKV